MYSQGNVRFREHCNIWHQTCKKDESAFDQQNAFPFNSSTPAQQTESSGQNREYRLFNGARRASVKSISSISGAVAYRVQPPSSAQGSMGWSDRHQKSDRRGSAASSIGSNGFPPRRTLIDTFVDRNEDYWKNRVTIKIDVAFTDHSHVIGKQGKNTQLVMKETGCHIHFPDANRNPGLEKSNMVSIAGPMQSVDKARRAIRELAPLVITLEMKNYFDDPNIVAEDSLIREISLLYGLNVLARTNRSSGTPFFVVRGSVNQTQCVREAVLRLQQHFMNTTTAPCSLALDVLRPQQPTVMGRDGANIQLISQRTGATIHYPRSDAGHATTFFVQGTIDAILSARQHLVGCLPLSFAFEIQKEEPIETDTLQKELGVAVLMRSTREGGSQIVIVKGQERQATEMYAVRRRLLGNAMPADELAVIANDFDFMKDFSVAALTPSPSFPLSADSASCTTVFTFPNSTAVVPFSPISQAPYAPSPYSFMQNVNDYQYFSYQGEDSQSVTMDTSVDSSFCRLSVSGIEPDSNGKTSPVIVTDDLLPNEAPLASGLLQGLQAAKKNQVSEGWKAPGAERSISADYEKQQVLATKAMLEKPNGPRVPTTLWSGMGFSRSMPSGVGSKNGAANGATAKAEEDGDANKIGPWMMTPATKPKKVFNATTYFDGQGAGQELDMSDTDDISILLSRLQLVKYADIFREQEIDMGTFLTMTESDLKELGVNTFGARRKLLVVISELKEKRRRGQ